MSIALSIDIYSVTIQVGANRFQARERQSTSLDYAGVPRGDAGTRRKNPENW